MAFSLWESTCKRDWEICGFRYSRVSLDSAPLRSSPLRHSSNTPNRPQISNFHTVENTLHDTTCKYLQVNFFSVYKSSNHIHPTIIPSSAMISKLIPHLIDIRNRQMIQQLNLPPQFLHSFHSIPIPQLHRHRFLH